MCTGSMRGRKKWLHCSEREVREGVPSILKVFQIKTRHLAAESRAPFAKAGPHSSSSHHTISQEREVKAEWGSCWGSTMSPMPMANALSQSRIPMSDQCQALNNAQDCDRWYRRVLISYMSWVLYFAGRTGIYDKSALREPSWIFRN